MSSVPNPYPLPANESERIAALRALGILDSGQEDDFDLLTRLAAQLCQVPYAFVTLVDSDRIWIKSAFGLGFAGEQEPRGDSACCYAILERSVLEIPDLSRDPRTQCMPQAPKEPWIMYCGAVLETSAGHRIGTLCVLDSSPRQLSAEQHALLQSLARLVVQLIELRATRRALERAAATDPLTGLANRRVLLHALQVESERCVRHGAGFCVVLIDLDHFKVVNDSHGHDVGDLVLSNTAGLLSSISRKSDLAARYGGEEFCVLLPHTDLEGGRCWAEHFRERLAAMEHRAPQGSLRISASIGVAAAPPYTQPHFGHLLRAADAAMYRAKAAGRDRVECALDEETACA